jgi:hypothetical protein
MQLSLCLLLIAGAMSPRSSPSVPARDSSAITSTSGCSGLPQDAAALGALRTAVSKARSAVNSIDFGKTSVTYAQGAAVMHGPVKAAQDFLGYEEVFASRAQSEPSLLYYWQAYTGAIDARKYVAGLSGNFRFVKAGDETSTALIDKWTGDLDASTDELDKAILSTGTLMENTLTFVDRCAFGITYRPGTKSGKSAEH